MRLAIVATIALLAGGSALGQELESAASLFGPSRRPVAVAPQPPAFEKPKIAEADAAQRAALRRESASLRGELAAAAEREAYLKSRVDALEKRLAAAPPPPPPLKAYCVDLGTYHDAVIRADGGVDVTIGGVTYSYQVQVRLAPPTATYVEPLAVGR